MPTSYLAAGASPQCVPADAALLVAKSLHVCASQCRVLLREPQNRGFVLGVLLDEREHCVEIALQFDQQQELDRVRREQTAVREGDVQPLHDLEQGVEYLQGQFGGARDYLVLGDLVVGLCALLEDEEGFEVDHEVHPEAQVPEDQEGAGQEERGQQHYGLVQFVQVLQLVVLEAAAQHHAEGLAAGLVQEDYGPDQGLHRTAVGLSKDHDAQHERGVVFDKV